MGVLTHISILACYRSKKSDSVKEEPLPVRLQSMRRKSAPCRDTTPQGLRQDAQANELIEKRKENLSGSACVPFSSWLRTPLSTWLLSLTKARERDRWAFQRKALGQEIFPRKTNNCRKKGHLCDLHIKEDDIIKAV